MAAFLSDEWLAAMDGAARGITGAGPLVVEQVVTGVPGRGEVRYAIVLDPEGARVVPGPAGGGLRCTVDHATAVALARGETTAQEALARGRLRLGGDVRALAAQAGALERVGDVFAAVRRRTEFC